MFRSAEVITDDVADYNKINGWLPCLRGALVDNVDYTCDWHDDLVRFDCLHEEFREKTKSKRKPV